MLQTSSQVRKIVKKAKKSRSLLVVHISHTPVIKLDQKLRAYIFNKLDVEDPGEPTSKFSPSKKPKEADPTADPAQEKPS